jgi:DNA-binding cell septation regulator SpoVG
MTSKVIVDGVFVFEAPTNNLIGTAKCTIFGEISFFVKIFNGKNGIFVALPNIWNKAKNDGKGAYEPTFYLSDELKVELNNAVIDKYNEKSSVKTSVSASSVSAPVSGSVSNVTPTPHSERNEEGFDDDDIPF